MSLDLFISSGHSFSRLSISPSHQEFFFHLRSPQFVFPLPFVLQYLYYFYNKTPILESRGLYNSLFCPVAVVHLASEVEYVFKSSIPRHQCPRLVEYSGPYASDIQCLYRARHLHNDKRSQIVFCGVSVFQVPWQGDETAAENFTRWFYLGKTSWGKPRFLGVSVDELRTPCRAKTP